MVAISSLWLPILLSAVLVWIGSFLMWVVSPHHKKDYKPLPNEDAAREALKGVAPGQYNIPHMTSMAEVKTDSGTKKFQEGPVGFLTVLPNGVPNMGKNMALSFIFYLAVGLVVAYIAGRTLGADAEYLAVFRLTGTVAWLAYGVAAVQDAIWFGRPCSSVAKILFDALVYAVLTAGVFGWLWPSL